MINAHPVSIALGLLSLFFAITFIQSGIDKGLNREGNLRWFQSVFEKTIIGRWINLLFYWITIQELFVGIWMLVTTYCFLLCDYMNCVFSKWGFVLCIAVLLQLFTGQRIAKDYVGASGIIPYILTAFIGVFFMIGN